MQYLFPRSTRGVTLTAEGELFQLEADRLLQDAGESVEKVRALARGEFGELDVGYSPSLRSRTRAVLVQSRISRKHSQKLCT
jgi:DNA-binding transcriptional LysR family regulator